MQVLSPSIIADIIVTTLTKPSIAKYQYHTHVHADSIMIMTIQNKICNTLYSYMVAMVANV